MQEHVIRLRAGWLSCPDGLLPTDAPASRLALPWEWPVSGTAPVRLVRFFQGPPLNHADEAVFLRLDGVDGLTRVELNGVVIACPFEGAASDVPLMHALSARNRLDLVVDPVRARQAGAPWGRVSLVIRPRGATVRPEADDSTRD